MIFLKKKTEDSSIYLESYPKETGFTLIELLVTFGIMMAISTAMMTYITSFSESTRRMEDKITLLQKQNMVQSVLLTSSAVCSCNLRPDAIGAGKKKSFNSTNPSDEKLTFNNIKFGCDPASSDLITIGEMVNDRQMVESIELSNFVYSGVNNLWTGDLLVNTTRMGKTEFKPIKIPISFNVETPFGPSQARIADCQSADSGGEGILNGKLSLPKTMSNITNPQQLDSDCFVYMSVGGSGCNDQKSYLSVAENESGAGDKSGYKGSCSNSDCTNYRVAGFGGVEVFVPKGNWIRTNNSSCTGLSARCVE